MFDKICIVDKNLIRKEMESRHSIVINNVFVLQVEWGYQPHIDKYAAWFPAKLPGSSRGEHKQGHGGGWRLFHHHLQAYI